MKKTSLSPAAQLRAFALSLPGTQEAFPWGERVVKVNKKVFVFLGRDDDQKENASPAKKKHMGEPGEFGMSVKLPATGKAALKRAFASPTEYGLGDKGWVSMSFHPGDAVPLDEMYSWIEESYRAVAQKTLVKALDQRTTGAETTASATPKSKKPIIRPRRR
jgi:predicted DNA-binding protein (MmcQ/YjbR family)